MTGLIIAALALPGGAPLLLGMRRRWRSALSALMPWAAAPALALALFGTPGQTVEVPWVLLGMRLGIDATGRTFLLFSATLWAIAGWYARGYCAADARRTRFAGFFLLTLAGNLGVILAQDVASFYLFFALMTFAAYGLIVHDGTAAARHAALVYLVMAILGEALLLVAFLLLVSQTGTLVLAQASTGLAIAPGREIVVGLLLAGFAIKVGVPLLHLWLPLAHPVAPTPASAVLSGVIIKAGLLGWLRFLPLGAAASGWAEVVIVAGLAAAFYGVVIGVTQRESKTVLAYSSVSQMGFMTVGVGAGLLAPQHWPALLTAVTLYALHHALAKGALFLGVGVARAGSRARGWVLAGLLLPALALAGAPLTSGMLAKMALKAALGALPAPWPAWLGALLPVAAVGTALLMARFLWVVRREMRGPHAEHPGLVAPWLAALGTSALLAWGVAPAGADVAFHALWGAAWPVLAGALVAAVAVRSLRALPWSIPPGDVLVPIEAMLRRFTAHCWPLTLPRAAHAAAWLAPPKRPAGLERLELALRSGRISGLALLVLLGAFVALLVLG